MLQRNEIRGRQEDESVKGIVLVQRLWVGQVSGLKKTLFDHVVQRSAVFFPRLIVHDRTTAELTWWSMLALCLGWRTMQPSKCAQRVPVVVVVAAMSHGLPDQNDQSSNHGLVHLLSLGML